MATPFKLTEPNRHLKQLFELAPMAMAIFDKDMCYIMANQQWVSDFRLEGKDIIGKSQYELFPKLHSGWKEIYERALQGQVVRSEKEASNREGKIAKYQWEVRPWTSEFGDIQGVLVTCSKQAVNDQVDLAKEETRLGTGINVTSSSLPILIIDKNGVILKWSLGAQKLLRRKQLAFEGGKVTSLLDGREADKFLETVRKVIDGGGAEEEFDLQSSKEEGISRWVLSKLYDRNAVLAVGLASSAVPTPEALPDKTIEKSESESLALLRLEVREAKDAEQQAKQREARLRNVLDLAPAGVLILDERSRPIYHNQASSEVIGRELQETESVEDWLLSGTDLDETKPDLIRQWRENVWRRHLDTILHLQHSELGDRSIELNPVALPGGGMLLLLRDITKERRKEELLRSIESRFRTVIQENPLPMLMTDSKGVIFEMNTAAEDFLNSPKAKARDTALSHWFSDKSQEEFENWLAQDLAGDKGSSLFRAAFKANTERKEQAAEIKAAPITDFSGKSTFMLCFLTPIKDSVEEVLPLVESVEELGELASMDFLLEPEEATETCTESVQLTLFKTDYHGKISSWSQEAENLFGYREDQIVGQGFHRLFRPSDATSFHMEVLFLLRAPSPFHVQWFYFHPQKGKCQETFTIHGDADAGLAIELSILKEVTTTKPVEVVKSPAPAPWTQTNDTSAVIHPRETLTDDQVQREHLLLKESHERIKNNLQLLSSMLNLQMSTLRNEEALDALRSSQNRVRSMAMIHKQLSEIASGASLDFRTFVDELVNNLRETYELGGDRVSVHVELKNAPLQDNWLAPLAFSLNEMLSNVFRHAFGDEETGDVYIRLQWDENEGRLSVLDTGRGMVVPSMEQLHGSAMGIKILRVFATQLNGSLQVNPVQPHGTEVTLSFPTKLDASHEESESGDSVEASAE